MIAAWAFPDVISLLSQLGAIFGATVLTMGMYLLIGVISDGQAWMHRRTLAQVGQAIVTVISGDDEQAEVAANQLVGVSPRVLLPVVQRLAADLEGDADDRIRSLVAVTGSAATIRRRMRSRRWRRRAQAAALASLLPSNDERRVSLLCDRHPVVRARAAENLDRTDTVRALPHLLRMLDDPSDAVRFSAQHALLDGDGRILPTLAEYLRRADGPGVVWALEVGASLRDPRLNQVMKRHVHSSDPGRRAMAARSLSPIGSGIDLIVELLDDPDAEVRATAAMAAASRPSGEVLAAKIGRMLSDRSWKVRREAGQALARMDATGSLVLRAHLVDPDPYARDMARRVLDDLNAGGRRAVMPAAAASELEGWEPEAAA